MDLQKIRLIVNGKSLEREIECRQNLADFLRHDIAQINGVAGVLAGFVPIREGRLGADDGDFDPFRLGDPIKRLSRRRSCPRQYDARADQEQHQKPPDPRGAAETIVRGHWQPRGTSRIFVRRSRSCAR